MLVSTLITGLLSFGAIKVIIKAVITRLWLMVVAFWFVVDWTIVSVLRGLITTIWMLLMVALWAHVVVAVVSCGLFKVFRWLLVGGNLLGGKAKRFNT